MQRVEAPQRRNLCATSMRTFRPCDHGTTTVHVRDIAFELLLDAAAVHPFAEEQYFIFIRIRLLSKVEL